MRAEFSEAVRLPRASESPKALAAETSQLPAISLDGPKPQSARTLLTMRSELFSAPYVDGLAVRFQNEIGER